MTNKNELEFAAGEAVFGLQLDRNQAVKFVIKNAGVDVSETEAEAAVDATMTGYKASLGG